ncbi:MAG: BatD family protein, partial [Xanthomonadales bacterium]|nr:BatD family protein [Xanthomonadales bacterium]
MNKWITASLAALSLMAAMNARAGDVVAELSRDQAVVGETLTLVLSTNDPRQSLETDLSLLEDDWLVLDRRSESQMSIVNGRQTATVRLLLTLEPRRAGDLEIPALTFPGGETTEPLAVRVTPPPEGAAGEPQPVFVEVELNPAEGPHYVHAQLGLTVRVLYQQNLTEAAIEPPEPDQATVRLLDEVPFQAERDGVRYRVLERRYAVFPERSGTLTIPPMQLSGRLVERPRDRLWQPAVRGRRITVASEPLTVEVMPRPDAFPADRFLPARSLELTGQVSGVDGLRVGEPVTRTVMVDATGLEEHMLIPPDWPEVDGARIYPDQPQGITRDDGQWVLGHREYRYAVVPEVPGELVLPALELHWWDTVNDRLQVATLPEQRITVAPSPLDALGTTEPDVATDAAEPAAREPAPTLSDDLIRETRFKSPWRWVAAAFFLL